MTQPKSKIALTRRDITKALILATTIRDSVLGAPVGACDELVELLTELDARRSKREKAYRTKRGGKPEPI